MRSIVVIVAAGAVFVGFLVKAHLQASRLRASEEAAYALLVRLAADRGGLPLARGRLGGRSVLASGTSS